MKFLFHFSSPSQVRSGNYKKKTVKQSYQGVKVANRSKSFDRQKVCRNFENEIESTERCGCRHQLWDKFRLHDLKRTGQLIFCMCPRECKED